MKLPLWLKENEQMALKELKERLSSSVDLRALSLFGSKARGEESRDADIDVMVEVEDYTPDTERAIDDIIFRINLTYDVFISATIFSRKELEDGPMSESPLYKSIERDGVPL
jgi:predicted nucleotidyltransferase